jgi:hypothetical protein
MHEWSEVPADALLSLRRLERAGAQEQWAVVLRDGAVVAQRACPEDGAWRDVGSFGCVGDAIARLRELRELHKGVASVFELAGQAGISVHEFVALLDLCPQEDSDEPDDWPLAMLDACEWEEYELWHWAEELPFIRRLASVNELEIAGIADAKGCTAVLADEDGFVALAEPAEAGTFARPGVSPAGWEGGTKLLVLAPGLACSAPWGDEILSGDNGFLLIDFPEHGTAQQVAATIASWLADITFDFWAALVLEPLDPGQALDDQGRDAWAEFEKGLTVSPVLRVPEGTESLVRAKLTRLSRSYARCAEARANPFGHVAKVMFAADQPDLHYGTWVDAF